MCALILYVYSKFYTLNYHALCYKLGYVSYRMFNVLNSFKFFLYYFYFDILSIKGVIFQVDFMDTVIILIHALIKCQIFSPLLFKNPILIFLLQNMRLKKYILKFLIILYKITYYHLWSSIFLISWVNRKS